MLLERGDARVVGFSPGLQAGTLEDADNGAADFGADAVTWYEGNGVRHR